MKTALWFESLPDKRIRCILCPHQCILNHGKTGICGFRTNQNGNLFTRNYGLLSAWSLDPIEKKPLYHFFPGKSILSLGSFGCNLKCRFCQNFEISQLAVEDVPAVENKTAEEIIELAVNIPGNIGIAFTYNEPTVWYEYMLEIAILSKKAGLKNVMVTNGYINPAPLDQLAEYMDAFSVDLKAFTGHFYQTVSSATLEPVLTTLEQIHSLGKHLEIVNLVIPGLNDSIPDFTRMIEWIAGKLGKETILHLSAYFPKYRLTERATEKSLLENLRQIARKRLRFVYVGNVTEESGATHCPSCNHLLMTRRIYHIYNECVTTSGRCSKCNYLIFSNY